MLESDINKNTEDIFNTEVWHNIIEETYGYKTNKVECEKSKIYFSYVDNEIGNYIVSPAFGDFIVVEKDSLGALEKLISEYTDFAISLKVCSSEAKDIKGISKLTIENCGFIHEIEYDSYKNWYSKIVKNRFKRNIIKSRKHGLKIKVETNIDAMKKFWVMHAKLRLNKFNEIPQPWLFFEKIYYAFLKDGDGFVINAYKDDGKIIAGILVLLHGDIAYYKFNASDLDNLEVRPNNLLLDRLINYLDGKNINRLNLGYTGDNVTYQGLRSYKLSMGAREFDRYTLRNYKYYELDKRLIDKINGKVNSMVNNHVPLDQIDEFSMKYYRYFV